MLREVGLVPTIQRLAILECMQKTKLHPTADQVLSTVRERFPSISRATVYNTLDALTRARIVLRLNVDPAATRYDADLAPHAHFRCRVCGKIYDIKLDNGRPVDVNADGHLVESVYTYAHGVCASCLENEEVVPPRSDQAESFRKKELETPSSPAPDPSNQPESDQPKESETRSASVPPRSDRKGARNA